MSSLNASDLHKIFKKLDKNGDGIISIDQLKWLLERTGFQITIEELQLLVGRAKSLDSIDFFIFYEIIVKNNVGRKNDNNEIINLDGNLIEAFKVFDLNGDGFISCEELQNVLSRFGLWDEGDGRDCRSMMNMFDTNSDGMLDFHEFKNMMLLSNLNS